MTTRVTIDVDEVAGSLCSSGTYAVGKITATDPERNTQSQRPTGLTACAPRCPEDEQVQTLEGRSRG